MDNEGNYEDREMVLKKEGKLQDIKIKKNIQDALKNGDDKEKTDKQRITQIEKREHIRDEYVNELGEDGLLIAKRQKRLGEITSKQEERANRVELDLINLEQRVKRGEERVEQTENKKGERWEMNRGKITILILIVSLVISAISLILSLK